MYRLTVRPTSFARLLPWLLLGLLLLSASGCGFKLRGLYDIPESLKRVAIDAGSQQDSQLSRTLEQALEANGVVIDNQAPYRIELLQQGITRRTLSLDSSARASEYELRGEVTFQVSDRDGNLLLPERTLMSERAYNVDSSNITASDSQEPILRQQIHQDLAQQIMRQYIRIQMP
ncbi:MAG: LPS assembly lipoprotein LptE [Nitrincola lacisaponensis]|uniref:LPS-assembly lipoprotein LptE n=1 Tax=Nitrincola lacisaponensis TaxID=267850 RepID=UPI00391C03FC